MLTEHLLRLGVQEGDVDSVLERWRAQGCPPMCSFAPYAAHVLVIEMFFYIASAAGLMPSNVSSWLDMCYLHYLPFCMVFVSSDKLHQRCAHLFMRPDQQFIRGADLKKDLCALNEHYLTLPEEDRNIGMSFIASTPPKEKPNLVATIWDRYFPAWRKKDERQAISAASPEMLERVSKFSNGIPLSREQIDFNPQDTNALLIKRRVRRKKGSWWQVPSHI